MNAHRLKALLDQVRTGDVTPDAALEQIDTLPFEDIGFAKVDHHRALRVGVPEVIFGPGKASEHFVEIFRRLAERGDNVLATRVSAEQVAGTVALFPQVEHNPMARTLVLWQRREKLGKGTIGIISAGTSDIPVAEEAAVTADVMGNDVTRLFDVGVAGLHRLLSHSEELRQARVLVVCAGMEGALPSVVGGAGGRSGDCGADQRGLWRGLRRNRGAAGHGQLLCIQRLGGEHRQRLRRGLCGFADQPPITSASAAGAQAGNGKLVAT